MPLHQLTSVTIGVPKVAETAGYYAEFGLTPLGDGRSATADAGEQLCLVQSPVRRLVEITMGADDPDDISRIARQLRAWQLLRVLLRPGLHHRRRAVEARRMGRREGPVQLGAAPSASFLSPEDLAALMTGAHSSR